FGKLFLINFAIGVATGIVQEFQFGMNWSEYSKFVGDIFGAPLAFEGLIAFFFESTFIGLWIFGWQRLPKAVHLACIWIVALGVNASAYFIIAANSFMQHPVGAKFNPESGRAELIDFGALLTNNTAVWAFLHAITAALLTAGAFVAGISAWLMVRTRRRQGEETEARTMYRPATILGSAVALLAAAGLFFTGDVQGKLMFVQQPMKMASAESLCHTETDPDFSILTVGTHNNCDGITRVVEVPFVLPFLAESKFSGVTLEGVEDLQQAAEQKFGPGNYRPNLFVTYWSFRAMIGLLLVPVAFALLSLWLTRRGRIPEQRWYGTFALLTIPTPFLASSAGWIFTEMGRQPWVVVPNPTGDPMIRMTVQDGVSNHAAGTVLFSLAVFTLLYGALAVAWFYLMRRYVVEGPLEHDSEPAPPAPPNTDDVAPLSFAY
ncbi:cytochrome ubiquinol oxidase subunit I, partial [Mycobacterium sp. ITM-2017-0098]